MADRIKLGIIFGGRSGEHEVSLMSAHSVLGVLDPTKYEVVEIGIAPDGNWLVGEKACERMQQGRLEGLSPATILPDPTHPGLFSIDPSDALGCMQLLSNLDVVFPVLHGSYGEDGAMQGLLELAGIAYVGAGILASSVGMDKALFKDVMRIHNIPVVESITVTRHQVRHELAAVIGQAEKLSSYPLFVKPANMGSSVGITKCRGQSELVEGLMDAARFDRRILIEHSVNAREIEVSVLGNENPRASLPGEIIPSDEFYSYNAKYIDNASQLLIPAAISAELTEQIRHFAIEAYLAIDCAGMARVDFFLDKDTGGIYLNELNTLPGFTSISMYPKLWEATGLPYASLVDELIRLALERHQDRLETEHRYGSGHA